jgi:hypothetical protein
VGHQQARNLLLVLGERGRQLRFVLRDRDAKFSRSFDDVFRAEGAEMLVTPVQAPNANAYAERWIRTVRAECLDWLLIFGRGHLEQVLRGHCCIERSPRATGLHFAATRRQITGTVEWFDSFLAPCHEGEPPRCWASPAHSGSMQQCHAKDVHPPRTTRHSW